MVYLEKKKLDNNIISNKINKSKNILEQFYPHFLNKINNNTHFNTN